MSIDGTFGDETTLRAAAELFSIEFVIISTLGRAAKATITPQNFAPQDCVYLGYSAENHFAHNQPKWYRVINIIITKILLFLQSTRIG